MIISLCGNTAERHISCVTLCIFGNFFFFVDLDFAYLKPAVIYICRCRNEADSFCFQITRKICFFYIDVLNFTEFSGKIVFHACQRQIFPCSFFCHILQFCMFKMIFSASEKETNAVNIDYFVVFYTDIIIFRQ